MKRMLGFVFAVTIVPGAMAQDYPHVLSVDGIGNIKIGMNNEQVERNLHEKTPYNQFTNHGCSQFTTPGLEPTGISFMIEQKRLTRINVEFYGTDPRPLAIKTEAGVGLGSAEEDVRKAYPNAVVKNNPSDPTWHTIVAETPDHSRGLIFETDGKKVKSMRAGENPAIAYADGCP